MLKPAMAATVLIAFSMPAYAAGDFPMATISTTLPREAVTVTDWYKQNVYDPNENKIGDIKDVLVDKSGKIAALIVGVGGFLGAGEKDVAVPFEAVHPTMKDKKWWLVMNTTKDSLKSAPGFKYDSTPPLGCLTRSNAQTWQPLTSYVRRRRWLKSPSPRLSKRGKAIFTQAVLLLFFSTKT